MGYQEESRPVLKVPVSHFAQATCCFFMGFHTKVVTETGLDAVHWLENRDFSSLKLSWLLPS